MEKSSASNQPRGSSVNLREQSDPFTPRPELMTPPTTQSMVTPTSSASQPPEMSDERIYLRILRDVAESMKPTGRLSEIFTKLASQLREEELSPEPLALGATTEPVRPTPALIAPIPTQATPNPSIPLGGSMSSGHYQVQDGEVEFKEAVECDKTERRGSKEETEGEARKLVKGTSERQALGEVIVVEERLDDDK